MRERVGEQRYAEFFARGAAMGEGDVVEFVRAGAAKLA